VAARVRVLGLPVDPVDLEGLLAGVSAFIEAGEPRTVSYLNVHVANVAAHTPDLRAFLEQTDLCYCDGAGIRLGAKLLGRALPERMTGADWIWDLAARAEGQWRIFWLGGAPGATAEACEVLRQRHPGLELGHDHGFHHSEAVPALIDRIHAFEPHILLVGMGTPVQERWVMRWRSELDVPVVWCLGATADFISGRVSRGPRVLAENAEWLARLVTEPRRLWRRYLVGNTVFLARVLRERALRG